MFEIEYRVICNEWDDFKGQNGYLRLNVNGKTYGDMYPEDLDGIMEQEDLYFWFHELCLVVQYLEEQDYVALSDVESHNTWIEFRKRNDELIISILDFADKNGKKFIEFKLDNPKINKTYWGNEKVSFNEFKHKIIFVLREYINYLRVNNKTNKYFEQLEHDISTLE